MSSITKSALFHFDKFYPFIYSNESWKSIRLGLICKSKKMFLINNACILKDKVIGNLQKDGAINFLNHLIIKEKNVENITDSIYLKHNILSIGKQLNEFVKTKEYIGERNIFTKSISNSFISYTSDIINEKEAEIFNDQLIKCKSEMLPYENIEIPTNLTVLAYPKGIIKKKYPVSFDEYNQSDIYPIDGSSLLVILFMDIKKGDKILDMCSAPGGKTVAMLQTGLPDEIVCIDECRSRIDRLKNVLKTHSFVEDIENKVSILTANSVQQTEYMQNYFDKVLLDAPCSSDRFVVNNPNSNLFSLNNEKRRQQLIITQRNLIKMAIKSCKIGGDVMYSTCTLSPVQNDKIILSVICEINKENKDFQMKVVNCRSNFFNNHKKYGSNEKLMNDWFSTTNNVDTVGQIVLPNVLNNYGPAYMCKLRKEPFTDVVF